jgi:hypothetical protein
LHRASAAGKKAHAISAIQFVNGAIMVVPRVR